MQNPVWLASVSLDRLGSEIEWTIHGWMHVRWSGPPFHDPQSADPANDWLYDPWSSHVNKTFWKLHGWIDERIGNWEKANSAVADLSNAWSGPPVHRVQVTAGVESGETNRTLAGIPGIRAVRFRFSQARVNRLLGRKAPAKQRQKAKPQIPAKKKSSGTKRPTSARRQR